jgi:hypothetical protein
MVGRILDSLREAFESNAALASFVVVAFVSLAWYSVETFASKDDLRTVHHQVVDLVVNVDRRYQEQRIHNIESEIFSLERLMGSGTARADDYDRLSKLRSELGSAMRELERIEQRRLIN